MQKEPYRPVPFVDMANFTWMERYEYSKHGVRDRDMPVIMELSGYKTVLRLFLDKVARRPKEELDLEVAQRFEREAAEGPPLPPMFGMKEVIIDPSEEYILPAECAHAIAPVIAKRFSTLLGVPIIHEEILYHHPEHPFLMAEPRYQAMTPDPETGEVNRLTLVFPHFITNWKRDAVLEEPLYQHKVEASYCMSIMGAADSYIVYLYDNNDGGLEYHYYPRNTGFEASLISLGMNFWNEFVLKEILPIPSIPSDIANKEMAEAGYYNKPYRPRPTLYIPELAELSSQYVDLMALRDDQKEQLKETESRIAAVKMQMATHVLGQREAECGDVRFSWKKKTSRSTNMDGLKHAYPRIYSQFVTESSKPFFEVKVKKNKANDTQMEEEEAA